MNLKQMCLLCTVPIKKHSLFENCSMPNSYEKAQGRGKKKKSTEARLARAITPHTSVTVLDE